MAVWEKLSTHDRIVAAHLDIMKEVKFAMLSGVTCIGEVIISHIPTAATDGRDCLYGDEFMQKQNRKQVRFVVIHENYHKALRHCVEWQDLRIKYPRECAMAMDYSINQLIFECDPSRAFVEEPAGIKILLDAKYAGMGWLEILKDLLKNPPPPPPQKPQQGDGEGEGGAGGYGEEGEPMDEHMDGTEAMSPEEQKEIENQIDSALRQGKILQDKLAGSSNNNSLLDGTIQERNTNWKQYLREFIETVCQGDDMSRFCPMNRRLQASGFLMPTHFTESTGHIIIAADTSGSMYSVMPIILGEIAQICKMARPEGVTLLWWDTRVAGVQEFAPEQYDDIGTQLSPKGGGGTTPGCVVKYVKEKKLDAKCVIWITDGYLDGSATDTGFPSLWAVLDNRNFKPTCGKAVHLCSLTM